MSKFPILYKRAKTGNYVWWHIYVEEHGNGSATITTEHGSIPKDSKANKPKNIIKTSDLVTKGKNIGKKNETTPYEQAISEAGATWTKKSESGYSTTKDSVDDDRGYIVPMLAHDFHKEKKLPKTDDLVFIQPKIDGMRCIAEYTSDGYVLRSRNGKDIPGTVEILNALNKSGSTVTFDGELFVPDIPFEELMHILRKEEPDPQDMKKVQFWIFDVVDESKSFEDRFLRADITWPTSPKVKKVPTKKLKFDLQGIQNAHREAVNENWEGIMIRIPDSGYEHTRSHKLLKYKDFLDDEFLITGVEEGRGKLSGHLASFILQTKDQKTFNAKMEGSFDNLKKMFKEKEKYIGKKATVVYQNLTKAGVPRFPIVKTILLTAKEQK